jgi:hypothetical protein
VRVIMALVYVLFAVSLVNGAQKSSIQAAPIVFFDLAGQKVDEIESLLFGFVWLEE